MKNNTNKLNNKGYSLIEMIIVVAIIAIVTAMSTVTVGMMHSAKVKDAATTFDSEISALISKTKDTTVAPGTDEHFVLKLYKDGNKYYLQEGTIDTLRRYTPTDTRNGGKGVSLSQYADIKFVPLGRTNELSIGDGISGGTIVVYFEYNKDGSVMCMYNVGNFTGPTGGTTLPCAGTYNIYKKNGVKVATEVIRTNGSHELR